jgi:hypothetical protein
MIQLMDIPPERLYRPDVSITAWRKWCQDRARGAPAAERSAAEWEAPPVVDGAEPELAAPRG